jgi:hypothetical protein
MKFLFFLMIVFFLLFTPLFQAAAQNNQASSANPVFDTTDFPRWALDLRRWDIITFGVFPFSMFLVTFTSDMIRYADNGFDGRYAPWPFKPAGGYTMTNDEYMRTFLIAAGLSATIAIVDLIIFNIRRNNERQRIQSRPSGTIDINRRPQVIEADEPSAPANDDTSGVASSGTASGGGEDGAE